jgi:hypothetical protein
MVHVAYLMQPVYAGGMGDNAWPGAGACSLPWLPVWFVGFVSLVD